MRHHHPLLFTTVWSLVVFFVCFGSLYIRSRSGGYPKINEIQIQKGQEVQASGIDFTVRNIQTDKTATTVATNVLMHINRSHNSFLGMKDRNYELGNNMFLNIPYGQSKTAETITDVHGNHLKFKDIQKKDLDVIVHFYADRGTYEQRNQVPEFSFMIPGNKNITKYSMKIS